MVRLFLLPLWGIFIYLYREHFSNFKNFITSRGLFLQFDAFGAERVSVFSHFPTQSFFFFFSPLIFCVSGRRDCIDLAVEQELPVSMPQPLQHTHTNTHKQFSIVHLNEAFTFFVPQIWLFFKLVAGAEWQLCPILSHRHGGFSEGYRPLPVIKQTSVSAAGEKASLRTAGEQLGPNKDTGLKGKPVGHLCYSNKAA